MHYYLIFLLYNPTDLICNGIEVELSLSNISFFTSVLRHRIPSLFFSILRYMCAFLLTHRNMSSIFGLTKISYANIFSRWLSQRARILFCGCLYLSFFLCWCISTKICFICSVRTILYVMMSVCMYVRILYDAVFWKHFIALL